jgi:hypothetical protein
MQISIADWNVIFAHPRSVRDSISIMTGERVAALANFSSAAAIYRGG